MKKIEAELESEFNINSIEIEKKTDICMMINNFNYK